MPAPAPLTVHPDRLLPADPTVRGIARSLYEHTKSLPIISPHSHVPADWLSTNEPFADPTHLLLQPDHYALRLLHANGADLSDLGRGPGGFAPLAEEAARRAWRILCENYHVFRGTPVKYWFDTTFAEVFGVSRAPSAQTADALYDEIAAALTTPEFRPRALFERFGMSVLATTDDPLDDLSAHAALAADGTFTGRVLPTFRPDRFLEPARADWPDLVRRLGEVSGVDTGDYRGYVAALENRRAYFKAHGAVSSDHSHADAGTEPLEAGEAAVIYAAALAGEATPAQATAFRRHMVHEMARMATEDGLVMTLHPAVRRNHDPRTFAEYGPDTGADIPTSVEFTHALQPLLGRFGNHPDFTLVVFTIDETVYSRELAPMAGFYRSMHVGVPWWFLDAPDAIRRFRGAVTETAGFYRTSGFIDDTRAFLSIPTRHDMARRLDAGYLAGLVAEHRLSEDEAHAVALDLVTTIPAKVFKL
ncbi:glucuronate isomerase [Pseudactinotalea sp. HY158]|uniref:glucuronate isomerase n=1 Tax=Pseudactinotalea sp. HY158 TaxID=2654547 RepID=UPI00129C29A7|nr:glucuronate isomerase [Pseudactinotalea sp. HY158]QGH69496.1 glucuronate isomerase [Pseudactinotalea sp. HY158]